MKNSSSLLDQPITLRCGVTLPNRIALAPLTNTQSNTDGTLHDNEFHWLTRRAGSFGLVSTCAAYVSEEGHAWVGQLGISDDIHVPGLTRLATAITNAGSIPIIQLHHGGKKADQAPQKISTVDSDGVVGASSIDIKRIISEFAAAAKRAQNAGFAGVEIHGANGYIFTQFLAPADNPRNDEYGGSIENRARFLLETVKAVRSITSSDFMVNVRISPVDIWDQKGLIIEDSIELVKWLAEDGVDIIHLSLREAGGTAPFEESEIPVVRAIRDAVPSEVFVASAGGIWTREEAEKTASIGADLIVLGRAAIIHPDWPTSSSSAEFSPITPPWDPDYMIKQAVGPKFLKYLNRFPGLVIGGTPARK